VSADAFIAAVQRSFAGVPSNDDVPRDEMLLALGLALTILHCRPMPDGKFSPGVLAGAVSGHSPDSSEGSEWSAAWNGADAMQAPSISKKCHVDEGNPDAYAAGAALAMALEGP
jgi:hypothetical protein